MFLIHALKAIYWRARIVHLAARWLFIFRRPRALPGARVDWYSIWMRNGIEPWMRGCNIWARRR